MRLQDVDYLELPTPLGPFLLAARDDTLKGGCFLGQKHLPARSAEQGWRPHESAVLQEGRRQLEAWFARGLRHFDLPLALEGTAFQQQVWQALVQVPWGQTRSYAQLALQIGRPEAFHPVGAAIARNPLLLIVPCHRAIGSDGSLTGYAGGLSRKRWLLDFESAQQSLFA